MARLFTTRGSDRRSTRDLPLPEAIQAIVVAILVGLIGMHALSPVPGSASAPGHAVVTGTDHQSPPCHHGDRGDPEGSASPMCQAAGVGHGPQLTGPGSPVVIDVPSPGPRVRLAHGGEVWTHGPPDRAELQVFRI